MRKVCADVNERRIRQFTDGTVEEICGYDSDTGHANEAGALQAGLRKIGISIANYFVEISKSRLELSRDHADDHLALENSTRYLFVKLDSRSIKVLKTLGTADIHLAWIYGGRSMLIHRGSP